MDTRVPDTFAAGTTVTFTATYSDFPPSAGWSAALHIAGIGLAGPVAGTVSGQSFAFTLTAANTSKLPPGNYEWKVIVTSGATLKVADEGVTVITANITQADAGDMQSFSEKMLNAIRELMLGRVPKDVQSYTIDNVAITKIPFEQLARYESIFANRVRRERNPGSFIEDVKATFTGRV